MCDPSADSAILSGSAARYNLRSKKQNSTLTASQFAWQINSSRPDNLRSELNESAESSSTASSAIDLPLHVSVSTGSAAPAIECSFHREHCLSISFRSNQRRLSERCMWCTALVVDEDWSFRQSAINDLTNKLAKALSAHGHGASRCWRAVGDAGLQALAFGNPLSCRPMR